MSSRFQSQHLKLESCCRDALREIRRKQEIGLLLQKQLATGPFVVLLGQSTADMLVSVSGNDWELWRQALRSVPSCVRQRCWTIAAGEAMRHGGALGAFWREMYESFL